MPMDLIDRQAAIEKLKREFNETDVPDRYPGVFDAIEEWLSECELPSVHPELDEWCTDCKEYDHEKHCCPKYNRVIREAVEEIRAERKKGRWIIKDNPGTGWYRVTCSECGEDVTSAIPVIGFFPDEKPIWNFCPECGADMRR